MCDKHATSAQLDRQTIDFMTTDPVPGFEALSTLAALSEDERKRALNGVRTGDITEMLFDAVVFRAVYPNANYLRFRDEDMAHLARSFAAQPFLRNHDTWDIGSRDGTIVSSKMDGDDLRQTIRMTSQRGMEDFLQGRIDRFSIGWYYDRILCSLCNKDWFECNHWPGKKYEIEGHDKKQLCELIFVNPTGKETSAVNVPAVRGTRVLADDGGQPLMLTENLAQLCESKRTYQQEARSAATIPPIEDPVPPSEPATQQTTTLEDLAPQTATVISSVTAQQEAITMDPEEVLVETTAQPVIAATSNGAALSAATANNTPLLKNEAVTEHVFATPAAQLTVSAPLAAPVQPIVQVATGPSPEQIAWLNAMKEATVAQMLLASGLSPVSQQAVRVALGVLSDADPARVTQLIESQRTVEAAHVDRNVVTGINPAFTNINGVMDSLDKYTLAFDAMLDGQRPAKGVKPLTGIREAYIALSGDYEMTGRFYGDRVALSNVNTSTMADLMAEHLNMRIIRSFKGYDQFWKPFCQVENFTSLHDPHWLILGGIGELSDVAEGAAYTEKDWAVQTETTPWMKKGNWLGLTLEAIDKDQTGYLQQAPRALAMAAYLSLGKTFTRIFTTANGAGYGPTIRDSKPLFHADHSNLGVLPLDVTNWDATRIAMARHTEDGSGEVLGGLTVPRYVMVPRHLENKALTIFATESLIGTSLNDINPLAVDGANSDARRQAARRQIVINDFMGLSNAWIAIADPNQYPLLGLGFRFGEAPEIYSVADEKSGLMFTNDVMPIKVRFFFSMGPMDYKGFYRQSAP